ncbi:unnamed protein product [Diatraea saccharalis]|uniref:Uncharacterized protein n=1 Tax=Diatraea saccharalis TaxID=40085 RepID=A0A9N9QWI8_9NEOP|nr:unnamed protein product [Diatraea saccharalis]
MQRVFIAFILSVLISIAHTKSTINKELLVNKKITFNQNQNDLKTVSDKTKFNNPIKLATNKEKAIYNNANTLNSNQHEYKTTDIISQHIDNVRNKNTQLSVKIINTNSTQGANFTKLGEKLAHFKLNTTVPKQESVLEMTAPTMIPIFRSMQNNIKTTPPPLPNELIRKDNVSNTMDNLNPNLVRPQNNIEHDNEIQYMNSLSRDYGKNEPANSTNGIEMLSLDEMLNFFKQQQNGISFQQVRKELNLSAEPSNHKVGIKEETSSPNILESKNNLNQKFNFMNTIPNGQSIFNSQSAIESFHGNIQPGQHTDKRQHPSFKIENIPVNPNIQNNLAPTDNLITVPNEFSTHSKTTQESQIFAGVPNNIIIEKMRFIPMSEMRDFDTSNALPYTDVPNGIHPIPSTKYTNSETKVSKEQIVNENIDIPRERSVVTNTKFNIPCHKAADILDDLVPYNPAVHQNSQSKLIPKFESTKPKLGRKFIETEKGTIEDESLAIIFKPKNISLLKLYGDVLKKITLTVLVPYHISKLTS